MNNYQKISKNIQELRINTDNKDKQIKWLNISNARKKEIEYLRKNFDFNLAHLQASSVKVQAQRSEIRSMDGYLFMTLHFPILQDDNIKACEIEFFLGQDYIITLHDNVKNINSFFNTCKKDEEFIKEKSIITIKIWLLEILNKLMLDCYPLLDQGQSDIDNIEEIIFSLKSKRAATQILSLRRNNINFRKIMLNHKNIIKKIIEIEIFNDPETILKKKYNQILEHSKRIWENLESQKEMIDVLNNTNESYLNYSINDVMKTLTIFSVIVFPLTLLAAIFGMNTTKGMPFIDTGNGFWMIIGIMTISCLGMLWYFKKKKWI